MTRTHDPARVKGSDIVVTPPIFSIAFGFVGLSGTWRIVGLPWTTMIADLLAGISTLLAFASVVPWLARLVRRESSLGAELRDPLLGPSVPVIAITGMLLSTTILPSFDAVGRTLVAVFAFLTLAAGSAVVGAWITQRLPLRSFHPGFYLPTAGATLLSAQCVINLGWVGLAQTLFFAGLVSWLGLGVISSLRLARTPLPLSVRPVLAIEIAAPALAGNAYLVVFHCYDGYALTLAAVTAVMGIVQLGVIPYYRRAPFGPGYWTAGFSYATAATLALRWIGHENPSGTAGWQALTLSVATGVLVLLSAATAVAAGRGNFFTHAR